MAVLPLHNLRHNRTHSHIPKIRFPERKPLYNLVDGVHMSDVDLLYEPTRPTLHEIYTGAFDSQLGSWCDLALYEQQYILEPSQSRPLCPTHGRLHENYHYSNFCRNVCQDTAGSISVPLSQFGCFKIVQFGSTLLEDEIGTQHDQPYNWCTQKHRVP